VNKQLVFVYGTLRKNEKNHHLLRNALRIAAECWTEGELYDSNLGYPFLVSSSSGRVYGELYQVDDIQLEALDQLEGYTSSAETNYYDRIEQLVKTNLGSFRAWVYVLPNGKLLRNMKRIECGDWCVFRLQ
jgi:gamma-glutamylcyclotransferase (GGCT)/AIG2-like uncharacterized protein YtfP